MVPAVSRGVTGAREAALRALERAADERVFLREALHAVFAESSLDVRDRALATQLATGAVRHRRTLRCVLSHVRDKGAPASRIQPSLLAILELGAFQLLFLERVPDYAAVSEAAEAARRASRGPGAGRKAAGFVNGVLRGVGRLIVGRRPEGRPARDALPHPEGGVVLLGAAVLPDPEADRVAFLGAAYSMPDWLVGRWLQTYGVVAAEGMLRWSNRRPRTFARANPMFHLAPGEHAGGAVPGPRAGCLDISGLDPARLESLLADGSLTIQDPSAMAAVEALAPRLGETVLDLCASPGTKTTQILEAMGGRGRIVACDRTPEKLEPLRRALAARGAANVTVALADDLADAAPPDGFDAALVDVPCSNTGVLARRVEARWRLRPEDLEELPRIQGELLAKAAGLVRPGGRLVYSTCSLEPEENAGVVAAFERAHPEWRLVASEQVLPAADRDGAFWALLVRAG